MTNDQTGLYLITGHSGSGKSTIGRILRKRGYNAVEGDTIARWVNKDTGIVAKLKNPTNAVWVDQHYWEWDRDKLNELSGEAGKSLTFLTGSSDHMDYFWPKFKSVFLLMVDTEITKSRVMNRIEHDYGKGEGQIERILQWRADLHDLARKNGAVYIDASPHADIVVNSMLEKI